MTTETKHVDDSPALRSGSQRVDSGRFYRPELDALRFFAFFGVFFYHVMPTTTAVYVKHHVSEAVARFIVSSAAAGTFGVPLFFLLSAYLITSLLMREKAKTGDIHLRSFYIRRILRIWPLYFLMLGIAALWPIKVDRLPASYLPGYLLLAGNWMLIHLGPTTTFESPLWSVSVEEQFYLFWPMFAKKLGRRALIYTAVGFVVLANVVRVGLAWIHWDKGIWDDTFAHLDSIGYGILCAFLLPEIFRPRISARALLALAGLSMWAVSGYFVDAGTRFTIFGYPAISAGALAIFLAVYGAPVRGKVLPYLGKISYGLYVYHMFATYLVGLLLHPGATSVPGFIAYFLASLALTVLFAAVSYRWLEAPLLRLKNRFTYVHSRPV